LDALFARYDPAVETLGRDLLVRLRERLPGATLLVFDNYNALGIGFSSTEKASGVVLSIVLYPRWVSLFFLKGAGLPDPEGLLQGSGSRVRHIRMTNAAMLDDPAVQALISEALDQAEPPIDPSGEQRLIVRSVSAKHRPRRPGAATTDEEGH
jgi:hypothetical protein